MLLNTPWSLYIVTPRRFYFIIVVDLILIVSKIHRVWCVYDNIMETVITNYDIVLWCACVCWEITVLYVIHNLINNKLDRYNYVFGNLYTFHYSLQPYRVSGRGARQHDIIISYNIILYVRINVIRIFDSKIFTIKIDVTDIIHKGKIIVGPLAYI